MHRVRALFRVTLFASCALLSACVTAGPGACSSDEREFFDAIHHFDGVPLEAEDHPYGVCGVTFTTEGPADAVIDHYLTEFEGAGWEVGAPDSGAGGGEPGVTRLTTLSAYRGTYQYHVAVSETETGDVHVNIMAGDAQP